MNARKTAIQYAKIAGYHSDTKSFTRLIVESRVNRQIMNDAWLAGQDANRNGVPCGCYQCKQKGQPWEPTILQVPLDLARRLIASGDYLCQRKSDGCHETVQLYAGANCLTVNAERMKLSGRMVHRINDLLVLDNDDCTGLNTIERWGILNRFANVLPLGYELEHVLDDVDAEIANGGEGAVLKLRYSRFGCDWLKAKRSENFIVKVSAIGSTQSVSIVDALTLEKRGAVKLGGGKCDRVRVGSILKVVGFGLTAKGFIREVRPDTDSPDSFLVSF